MKLYEILIFTGVLFVGVLSFSIRELELDDDELDQLDHAAVARAVVHKSGNAIPFRFAPKLFYLHIIKPRLDSTRHNINVKKRYWLPIRES